MKTPSLLHRAGALGLWLALGAVTVPAAGQSAASESLDPELPVYARVSGVSGQLGSVGSDTLNNLMTLWAEAFEREYPNVNIQIQGMGSSTAPPALTEGTANFGPMSRRMKPREQEAFVERHGYEPTVIRVGIDALAVYVNKDNPIEGMTVPEVDAAFSVTRSCGHDAPIHTWGDVGLTGAWAARPIQLYGRNSVSGTYGYFKEQALCRGDFRNTVNEQPGSASVVQAVTESLNGLGYSGIGYRTSGVRAVPLARREGQPFVHATPDNAITRRYPLARFLYVYVNKRPDTPLPPLTREFLRLVLSRTGQEVVLKDGYIPLNARLAERELRKLD